MTHRELQPEPELVEWLLGDGDSEVAASEEPADAAAVPDDLDEDDADGDRQAVDLGMDVVAQAFADDDELDKATNTDDEVQAILYDNGNVDVDGYEIDEASDRDERVGDYGGDAPHLAVREYVRKQGVVDEIQDVLEDLGEVEENTTDREGELLDMRNVTRRLAGDTTVTDYYQRRKRRPGDDVAVGISLDMSGSMSSDEREAKAAIGAFLFAVQQGSGDVVANAWQYTNGTTHIRRLTYPTEPFRWEHLDAVEPGGADPISRGMLDCARMLKRMQAREKLLLVVTDGRPTVCSREDLDGDDAVKEATQTVEEIRSQDVAVIGFGFGSVEEENLQDIFGEGNYHHVTVDDLADALTESYENQVSRQQQIMV